MSPKTTSVTHESVAQHGMVRYANQTRKPNTRTKYASQAHALNTRTKHASQTRDRRPKTHTQKTDTQKIGPQKLTDVKSDPLYILSKSKLMHENSQKGGAKTIPDAGGQRKTKTRKSQKDEERRELTTKAQKCPEVARKEADSNGKREASAF